MKAALFDPITNSEDNMIIRAGIPRAKACTFLRAYIMASLCFEPYFVISDTSLVLNKAFRTLIDYREGAGYDLSDLSEKNDLPNTDFAELILNGHIGFATRDIYKENFFESLRASQKKMKDVDLPNKRYIKMIDDMCSNNNVRKYCYNLDKISHMFTNKFKNSLNDELYENHNILPENAKLLQKLIRRLSDEEILTYNMVKSILLEDYKLDKKDERYIYMHKLLRKAYDYNLPDVLEVDHCMSLNTIEPDKKQEWKLELSYEWELKSDFLCDIYGFAKLPVSHLKYIWDSKEYTAWEKQISDFRKGTFNDNEYIEVLNQYLLRINDVVRDVYALTNHHNDLHRKKEKILIGIRSYCSDDIKVVIAKSLRDIWTVCRNVEAVMDPNPWTVPWTVGDIFFKMLPNLVQKSVNFPDSPEEMEDAVILRNEIKN